MKRDFKQAKGVIKYLEGRYGSIRKHTISDDMTIVNNICDNHSLEEIKMMKNRINALINLRRDTSNVNDHPMNLLIAFFTAVSALILGMVTIGSQWLIPYIGQGATINQENEFISSIIGIAITFIVIVYIVIAIGVYLISLPVQMTSNKYYHYSVLIEEAFEKKNKDNDNS